VRRWADVFLRLPPSRRPFAILEFCQVAIAYVKDPRQEVLEDADAVIERGYGDCDAKQRLLVALCTACGIQARALPVIRGDAFPHVLAELHLGGRWVPADPTILNSRINAIPPASQAVTNYW
jgi:transglutaminase-like putative cysteine protease